GLLRVALVERFLSRRLHSPLFHELLDAPGVYGAPDAGAFTRREPDHVAFGVQRLANTVDPAVTQRLVYRLWPRHGRFTSGLLMVANPELRRLGVVLLEPLPEFGGRRKKDGRGVD